MIKDKLRSVLPSRVIGFYHSARNYLAGCYYRWPSRDIKVIGVTGTNGKTTTSHLINHILEFAGYKTGMITTTTIKIDQKKLTNKIKMTTPDPFTLFRLIRKMKDNGCQYLILETSSHAIAQHRVDNIEYDMAVMTNLTREHLDYHKTFAEYKQAKYWLFDNLTNFKRKPNTPKIAILNRDDRSYQDFSQAQADRIFAYGILKGDIVAKSVDYYQEASQFLVETPIGQSRIKINLPGRFNVYNTLAAISAAVAFGINLKIIKQALATAKGVPGRMEIINQGQDFKVIVDYAHTPDGLNQVLQTLKPDIKGKLIIVVGAEGRRSKTKRPLLGALSAKYGDYVIVSNVDPRDEDPKQIINDVADGALRARKETEKMEVGKDLFKIADRKEAIKKAFDLARPQDTVLLLAKGAEQAMEFSNKTISWDDREVAKKLLKGR
jgi:UDP-N-acetylmuramoyl-L-alanyl-D-glutamate--2,6-diaminopimelate ligase